MKKKKSNSNSVLIALGLVYLCVYAFSSIVSIFYIHFLFLFTIPTLELQIWATKDSGFSFTLSASLPHTYTQQTHIYFDNVIAVNIHKLLQTFYRIRRVTRNVHVLSGYIHTKSETEYTLDAKTDKEKKRNQDTKKMLKEKCIIIQMNWCLLTIQMNFYLISQRHFHKSHNANGPLESRASVHVQYIQPFCVALIEKIVRAKKVGVIY